MSDERKAQWRKRVRRERPQLRALINDWNPIGVGGLPEDEYDCLVDHILSKLYAGATGPDLANLLETELDGHFGITPPADVAHFADRVLEWFAMAEAEAKGEA